MFHPARSEFHLPHGPRPPQACLARIAGPVLHGDKIGRTLGFPTANLSLREAEKPASGIYAARARLADGRAVSGVAYVGKRPTIGGVEDLLEMHLFDFDDDLYGQRLAVELLRHIRADQAFDSLDALRDQIGRDCAAARAILREDRDEACGLSAPTRRRA